MRLQSEEAQVAKPVRPKEFRSFMVLPFVLLQVALAIVLGVLLHKSQPFGKLYVVFRVQLTYTDQVSSDHLRTLSSAS